MRDLRNCKVLPGSDVKIESPCPPEVVRAPSTWAKHVADGATTMDLHHGLPTYVRPQRQPHPRQSTLTTVAHMASKSRTPDA